MSELIFALTISALILLIVGLVFLCGLLLLVLEQKGADMIEWCIHIWQRLTLF